MSRSQPFNDITLKAAWTFLGIRLVAECIYDVSLWVQLYGSLQATKQVGRRIGTWTASCLQTAWTMCCAASCLPILPLHFVYQLHQRGSVYQCLNGGSACYNCDVYFCDKQKGECFKTKKSFRMTSRFWLQQTQRWSNHEASSGPRQRVEIKF